MAARTRAAVRQPAPSWSGTSLWNGDFEELASEHYRGVFFMHGHACSSPSLQASILWCSSTPTTCKHHRLATLHTVVFCGSTRSTFVCPTELLQLSEKIPEFSKLHCAVVACSCDSQYSHLAWSVLALAVVTV